MAADGSPISASRFSISVDGVQIGSFAELTAAIAPGSAPRNVQPHELAHVAQQARAGAKRFPTLVKGSLITLKRGVMKSSVWMRMQQPTTGSSATVMVFTAGNTAQGLKLLRARIDRSTAGRQNGGDVAIEELVLSHEGFA